jgi:hypothetical protein
MPLRCTCGAELPPNALFCHMCGRPQREEFLHHEDDEPGASEAEVVPAERRPKGARGVSFANLEIIRAAYPLAVVAAILGTIPSLSLFCFLWYPAAGFAAVYLYRRRTGIYLTPREGVKMGAITGLLVFTISFFIMTIGLVFGGTADFTQALRQAVEQSGQSEELQRSVLQMIEKPAMLALMLMVGLFLRFLATTGFTMLGGALGAKVLEKED